MINYSNQPTNESISTSILIASTSYELALKESEAILSLTKQPRILNYAKICQPQMRQSHLQNQAQSKLKIRK